MLKNTLPILLALGFAGCLRADSITLPASSLLAELNCNPDEVLTCVSAINGTGVPSVLDYSSDGSFIENALADASNNRVVVTDSSTAGSYGAVSYGSLQYYFEVTGPTPSVLVDISAFLSASGFVTGNTPGEWSSSGSLSLPVLGQFSVCENNYNDCNGALNGLINISQSVLLATNQAFEVTIDASGSAGQGDATQTTTIDPYFAIDPSVADPTNYTISFSDAVGNGSSTPEPSTVAVIGVGLGFLAWKRTTFFRRG